MLGRLARWLLLMGYDTAFVSRGETPDMDAVGQAAREGRVFLTRDTRIPEVRGARKVVLRGQQLEDQLRQLFKELGEKPDPALYFTRCSLCNVALKAVEKEAVLAEVPEKVKELDTPFFRCPRCAKLYWAGTHVQNTLDKVRKILA